MNQEAQTFRKTFTQRVLPLSQHAPIGDFGHIITTTSSEGTVKSQRCRNTTSGRYFFNEQPFRRLRVGWGVSGSLKFRSSTPRGCCYLAGLDKVGFINFSLRNSSRPASCCSTGHIGGQCFTIQPAWTCVECCMYGFVRGTTSRAAALVRHVKKSKIISHVAYIGI